VTVWGRSLTLGAVAAVAITLASCVSSGGVATPADVPSSCDELISNQNLYEYNPNLAANPAYEPSPLAANIVAEGGISCGWLNASNGIELSMTMRQAGPDEWQEIRAAAADEAGSTPLTKVDGVISYSEGLGVVQAYISGRWVVIESTGVSAEGDVLMLLRALSLPSD